MKTLKYVGQLIGCFALLAIVYGACMSSLSNAETRTSGQKGSLSIYAVKGNLRSSTGIAVVEVEGQKFLVVDNYDGVAVCKF